MSNFPFFNVNIQRFKMKLEKEMLNRYNITHSACYGMGHQEMSAGNPTFLFSNLFSSHTS